MSRHRLCVLSVCKNAAFYTPEEDADIDLTCRFLFIMFVLQKELTAVTEDLKQNNMQNNGQSDSDSVQGLFG